MGAPSKDTCLGSPGRQEKRDKRHGRFRGDQEQHVISIKSRRPRRRFSLLPHGERSGRLRSRRPRGSVKFPLPSRRLHRVDSTFLPWAPLPSLRRHAAAGAHFHKLARPSATARLRSHHVQQLLHSGLAWLGDQGVKSSSSSTASSTASYLFLRAQHRFGVCVCVHTPPCFQPSCFRRWCRTCSVLAALPSRGGGHASGHRGRFHRRRL